MSDTLPRDYPVQPVAFTKARFGDRFWAPRLETNRAVTVPYTLKKCEETGRVDNFLKAAGRMPGAHEGLRFNDSDVFKVIEGAAYSLQLQPDAALDRTLDELIVKIAAAQEADGYLYTARTINPAAPARDAGPTRWSYELQSHELYNVGHLYEAAVAHYLATGKRSLLDVALKNADLIDRTFGPRPGQRRDISGHQEIEIGLVKLYRVTGAERYLRLSKFLLDERGHYHGRQPYAYADNPGYMQDHLPVTEQGEAVGHAVRAGYMYAAMADVAALTGDAGYMRAMERIWQNVVEKKLYITGGIGARHQGEAFGEDYELPNDSAYNETCAAIANVLWNERLFLLHGEAKYLDVLERTLYNGYLAGVAFSGSEFFYPNPLAFDGVTTFNQGAKERSPWFHCSCCPSNVVRFMPSLPGYAYAQQGDALYVNLYVAGEAEVTLPSGALRLTQATDYPWSGQVVLTLAPERESAFRVLLRIPSWVGSQPTPGDLYRYVEATVGGVALRVNGAPQPLVLDRGFAVLSRTWRAGDRIELELPMPVRRVLCDERVAGNRGRVAVERGPLVYCAEGVDNGGQALALTLADDAVLTPVWQAELLHGIMALRGVSQGRAVTLIPYYAWAHRGVGEMAVWLKRG
jgi:hypothetical protein